MRKFDIDARCMRCLKRSLLSPPPDLKFKNKTPDWEFVVYRTNGWLYEILIGRENVYILCPDCIRRDLERYYRVPPK